MKKVFVSTVAREFNRHENSVTYHYPKIPSAGKQSTYTRVISCREQGNIELTIDVATLIDWMGRRALASKRGISKLQDGLITAKVVGNRRTEEVVSTRDLKLPQGAEEVAS